MRTKDVKIRFWEKVKRLPSGCWEWTAQKGPGGYGRFWLNGRMQYSHRVSWVLANEQIPAGLYVLHHCDNPSCVRPCHLFVGTIRDNCLDSIRKGRSCRGERNRSARLVANDVIQIRRDRDGGESIRSIASRYEMTVMNISCIVRGLRWKHLPLHSTHNGESHCEAIAIGPGDSPPV